MATNTPGTQARQLPWQAVHYLRKDFSFADTGAVLSIGVIPAGSLILGPLSGVQVNVAFTAADTKILDIGTPDNDDLYAEDLDISAIAFVPLDTAVSRVVSEDTEITATPSLAGANNDAGEGVIVIAYIPNIG